MSWRKVKLGDLVEHFSIRAKDVGGASDLQFFGVNNQDGISITKYAAEDKAEDYKIIEKGCIAYNPYRVNVGSIGIFNEDIKGLISPAYVVFKPKPRTIIPQLLLTILKSGEGLRRIRFQARGTVRQALRFEDLCNIELFLPDYDEQIKLFQNFTTVDIKISDLQMTLNHQFELLKRFRKKLLDDSIKGNLTERNESDVSANKLIASINLEKNNNPLKTRSKKTQKKLPEIKEEEIPFAIPSCWSWCRLGEIVDLITSGSRDWAKYYSSEGALFLRMGNLSRYSFNLRMDKLQYVNPPKTQEGNRTRLKEGDILISITGEVGNLGLIPPNLGEAYINQHTALVRLNKKICIKFICYLFLSETLQSQFDAPQRGIKNAFRLTDIEYLLIPLPPVEEQERIVSKIEQLMNKCDLLENSIAQTSRDNEQLRNSILREIVLKQK